MKKCPNCGTISDSKFCPDCGTKLETFEESKDVSLDDLDLSWLDKSRNKVKKLKKDI